MYTITYITVWIKYIHTINDANILYDHGMIPPLAYATKIRTDFRNRTRAGGSPKARDDCRSQMFGEIQRNVLSTSPIARKPVRNFRPIPTNPARISGVARQKFGQGLWELDRLDGAVAGDLTHVAETPDQIAARSRNAHLRFVLKA